MASVDRTRFTWLLAPLSVGFLITAHNVFRPASARAGTEPETTILDIRRPDDAPVSLGEALGGGVLGQFVAAVDEARQGGVDWSCSPTPEEQTDFESAFPRVKFSVVDSLVRYPQVVKVEDLVRSVELNPTGRFVPASVIAHLDQLLSAYQRVIREANDLRQLESHYISLDVAMTDGAVPVASYVPRIPEAVVARFHELALVEDPTAGEVYKRVRSGYEGRYVQEYLKADVLLSHGGASYLLPQGTVHPQVAHYVAFIDDHALALVYDVVDIFGRGQALNVNEMDKIITAAAEFLCADKG